MNREGEAAVLKWLSNVETECESNLNAKILKQADDGVLIVDFDRKVILNF